MHFPRILLFSIATAICHPVWCVSQSEVPAQLIAESRQPSLPPAICLLPGPALLPLPPIPSNGPAQAPAGDLVRFGADRQEKEGSIYHLRGNVDILYRNMQLFADEVDYNEETQTADARGHVHFQDKARDE